MKFLGLLVILVGAYLTDSAVQNRSPVDTVRELIKDPSDLTGTLARLKGKWTTLNTAPAASAGGGTGSGAGATAPRSGQSGHMKDSELTSLSWAPGKRLSHAAAASLETLNAQYRARFGANIPVGDAYRSYAGQVAAKAAKGRLAATPGTSNHGWGNAIDLSGWRHGSPQDQWLKANGPKLGWVHPAWAEPGGSKPEPWHWEFTGGS